MVFDVFKRRPKAAAVGSDGLPEYVRVNETPGADRFLVVDVATGKYLATCVAVHTREGWAEVLVTDAEGEYVFCGKCQELVTRRITGHFRLVLKPAAA